MQTISVTIFIGSQAHGLNISTGHTPAQLIAYLREAGHLTKFQGHFFIVFNGNALPQHEPVGNYGVGSGASLYVGKVGEVLFEGTGKESVLQDILGAIKKTK